MLSSVASVWSPGSYRCHCHGESSYVIGNDAYNNDDAPRQEHPHRVRGLYTNSTVTEICMMGPSHSRIDSSGMITVTGSQNATDDGPT